MLFTCVDFSRCVSLYSYFCVLIKVPDVQATHSIHCSEDGRVHWRPHDIKDVVNIVLKGAERFVMLCLQDRHDQHINSNTVNILEMYAAFWPCDQYTSNIKHCVTTAPINYINILQNRNRKKKKLSYFSRPQFGRPVKGWSGEEVGEINGAHSIMAADASHWPLVAHKHLANTRPTV